MGEEEKGKKGEMNEEKSVFGFPSREGNLEKKVKGGFFTMKIIN